MSYKKIYFIAFFCIVILFTGKSYAQENEETFLDSIDYKENLLDSNLSYKKLYDTLSADGDWIKVSKSDFVAELDSGSTEEVTYEPEPSNVQAMYFWRPRGVDFSWNPYSNGRWVFTYYGWSWESYYDWGWAPFNYGRWWYSSYYGWIWIPGSYWAPNWVMWRNSGNCIGWYPHPPRIHWRNHHGHWRRNHVIRTKPKNWVFVEKKNFTKPVNPETAVSKENNSDLLKSSTKITQVNNYDSDKEKIVYKGPDANEISKLTGTKIKPEVIKFSDNTTKPKDTNKKTPVFNDDENRSKSYDGSKNSTNPGNNNPGNPFPKSGDNGSKNPPPSDNGGSKNPPPRDNGGSKSPPPRDNGGSKSPPPRDNGGSKSPPPSDNGGNKPRKSDSNNWTKPGGSSYNNTYNAPETKYEQKSVKQNSSKNHLSKGIGKTHSKSDTQKKSGKRNTGNK